MANDLNSEKAKWDAIYEDYSETNLEPGVADLSIEFYDLMQEILPSSAKILESGCGSGAQSLFLAKKGGYELTLLDFSENALQHARSLYAAQGAHANFILGDMFEEGEHDYDLVHNFGVLEHYDFETQVKAVKAMASHSRRYVAVAVPNRDCYWYWLWRLQQTSSDVWPYGMEVPLRDMKAVFESAGLTYLGHKYIGSSWTKNFINGLDGLSEERRSQILDIHRCFVVEPAHSCYLLLALGVVDKDETKVINWYQPGVSESTILATQIAVTSDALASSISLRNSLYTLQKNVEEKEKSRTKALAELDQQIEHLNGVVAERDRIIESLNDILTDHKELLSSADQKVRSLEESNNVDIAELGEQIERLNEVVAERERMIESLNEILIDQKEVVSKANQKISDLEDKITEFIASTSWRLSAPIRVLGRVVFSIQNQARHIVRKRREIGSNRLFNLVKIRFFNHFRLNPYSYKFYSFVRLWKQKYPIDWPHVNVPFDPGLVSIVLPAFNGEAMLVEAMESIINQTYRNIEIIAINDGSSDRTSEILKSYAKKDKRIKAYNQKNQKLPKTLSRGFRLARGEFMTWTSVDNRLKNNCIELMVASMRRNPNWDMVYANIDIIGEDGKPLVDSEWYEGYQNPRGSEHVYLPTDTSELNDWPNNFIGAAFLYRSRVAWAIGDYSESRFLTEDYDYWMRVNELMTLRHVDFQECIYDYRFHSNSLTSKDKELGITRNRVKLMVFDEFRRSFYLSNSIWIVTNDGSSGGEHLEFLVRTELRRRNSLVFEVSSLKEFYLPNLWMPACHIYCTALPKPPKPPESIIETACQIYLSLQQGEIADDELWDLCITKADVTPSKLRRLDGAFRGWLSVQSIRDIVTLCDIQTKNKQLSKIESIAATLQSCPHDLTVSVVVCTYQRSATLDNCLRSLINQTLSADKYEIILVNNDPSDKSPRNIVKKIESDFSADELPTILITDCPIPGLSHARNAGISACSGDYVIFIDDDAITKEDCLEYLANAFIENPYTAVIGGHIRLNVPNPRPEVCPPGRESLWSEYLTDLQTFGEVENWWEFPYGALWGATRKALFEMGGFRYNFGRVGDDFGGGEEIVAALLARNLGYRVGVEPRAEVLHDVDEKRYSKSHVIKTVRAGMVANYRMQVALYRPSEGSLFTAVQDCAKAKGKEIKLIIKKIFDGSITNTEVLYLKAYASGKIKVFTEKLSDSFNRVIYRYRT